MIRRKVCISEMDWMMERWNGSRWGQIRATLISQIEPYFFP